MRSPSESILRYWFLLKVLTLFVSNANFVLVRIPQLFKRDFLEKKALNEQILVFEMYGICRFTKFLLHRNDKWINE